MERKGKERLGTEEETRTSGVQDPLQLDPLSLHQLNPLVS